MAAVCAVVAGLTMALTGGHAAEAVDIRVFCVNGTKRIMADLEPRFESASGDTLIVTLGGTGELRHRILGGEGFDVALLPAQTLRDMATLGKVAANSMVDISRSDIGMAVREGAAKPAGGSVEEFKAWLLAASTIAVTDPASGDVSGVHFAGVLKQLGIADAIGPRLRLTTEESNAELVARGEAEMAVQLAHQIRAVAGVEFVPFPLDFQRGVVFAAGIAAAPPKSAAAQAAANALIVFLSGPAAAPMIIARGMQPAK